MPPQHPGAKEPLGAATPYPLGAPHLGRFGWHPVPRRRDARLELNPPYFTPQVLLLECQVPQKLYRWQEPSQARITNS
eukprot:3638459-Pyramimonas_sp.AAC.1